MEFGCSSISLKTLDGNQLLGRTYDMFGNLRQNKIVFTPRNQEIYLEMKESKATKVVSRYAFLGMAVLGFKNPLMVDGVNEKGLMGALLNYPKYAIYDTQKGDGQLDIHPAFFLNYLLSQCANIEEAVVQIAKLNLIEEKVYGKDMRVHYILSDSSGETIIVEPDREGIIVHRHTIGVLTNSPNYIWHRTNLSNFVGVTNLHKPPQTIINHEVKGFGEGVGGGFGLPGDYSSTSRFVRMAFHKHFAVDAKNELEGVTKLFHNFATVDIPEGILRESQDKEHFEQTLSTSVMCAESLTYYFATASNRRISAIKLGNELNGTEMKWNDNRKRREEQESIGRKSCSRGAEMRLWRQDREF